MKTLLALLFAAAPVFASAPPYTGISQPAGGKVTQYLSGNLCVAASSTTAGTCAVNVDGSGNVTGSKFVGGSDLQVLTPQQFGAKANCAGLVDDAAAIQAAVNACGTDSSATARCRLHFPAGCYYTKSSVVVSSKAYITIEGDGRFNTYLYSVGGSSGALVFEGGRGLGASSSAISNLGGTTVSDIALGSMAGPALYYHANNNALATRLFLFSAGPASPYLRINGGGQHQFSDLIVDGGNTAIPPDPSGYLGGLIVSSGTSDITIESVDSPPVQAAEMTFENVRTGAYLQGAGNSINVINSTNTLGSIAVFFNNMQVKARNGGACFHIDGAQVWIDNSYCETTPLSSSANGIYAQSTVEPFFIGASNSNFSGPIEIDATANIALALGSTLIMSNLSAYQLIVDSIPAPTTVQMSNVNFQIPSTTAFRLSNASTLSSVGAVNAGAAIGLQGAGEGFTGPNAAFTIAGDALNNAQAPILSLSRLQTGHVQKWNLGVDSDGTLKLVDATNNASHPVYFSTGTGDHFYIFSATGISVNSSMSYPFVETAAGYFRAINASSTGTVVDTRASPVADVFDARVNGVNFVRVKASGDLDVSKGSVTASAFYGDGSHLSGITATGGASLAAANTFASSQTINGGTGGLLVKGDSVTASAFFGDGSHLTGISGGGGSSYVLPSTVAATNADNNFSVTQTLQSSATVNGAGGLGVRYGVSANTATITSNLTAGKVGAGNLNPAYNLQASSGALVDGSDGLYVIDPNGSGGFIQWGGASTARGTLTNSGTTMRMGSLSAGSNTQILAANAAAITVLAANQNVGVQTAVPATALDVNGNAQFGSGATKSTFTTTGSLTLASAATMTASTYLGVSGATESVNASMTGVGTAASPLGVNSASGTLAGNTFNGASQLVQTDSSGRLPAIDGSQLMNLPGGTGETNTYVSSKTLTAGLKTSTASIGVIVTVPNTTQVLFSSGAVTVQSTSTTAGYLPLDVRNASAVSILNVAQSGQTTLNAGTTNGFAINGTATIRMQATTTGANNIGFGFQNSFNGDFIEQEYGNSANNIIGSDLAGAMVLHGDSAAIQLAPGNVVVLTAVSGKVGIGTFVPQAALEVQSSTKPTGYALSVSSQNGQVAGVFGVTGGGHVVSSGTIPGIACGAGSPTMNPHSNDVSGSFAAGTGATACTVTFSAAWSNLNGCWSSTNAATPIALSVTSLSNTAVTFTALGALTGDTIYYYCYGAP